MLFLFLYLLVLVQETTYFQKSPLKGGVVLSWSETKWYSRIGVLKALEKVSVQISYVLGVSMGAIIRGFLICCRLFGE